MAAGEKVFDSEKLYIREFERQDGSILNISQSEIGDVGCVVWDAAIVLASYLECEDFKRKDGEHLFSGKKVVELGAGTGMVGLQAACLGADSIITDLPEFVPLIQHNIDHNKALVTGNATAKALTWGAKLDESPVDFVLLADCIYYEQSLEPLVETLRKLSSPSTVAFCCYEQRTTGNKPQLEKRFLELIEEHFTIEKIPLERQHETYRSDDIHILKLALKT